MRLALPVPSSATIALLASLLRERRCLLWCGFGARGAHAPIRELVSAMNLPLICTPRGKGVLPDDHPNAIGATGIATNNDVAEWVAAYAPEIVIVLGARLDELASLWDERFLPSQSIVHVDSDELAFGGAYPMANCEGIVADIHTLCVAVNDALMLEGHPPPRPTLLPRPPAWTRHHEPSTGRVRPSALMEAIQRVLDEVPSLDLYAEAGNSFLWCSAKLSISEPSGLRLSTAHGAMGHISAGVVGAALATGRRTLAVVGDGALCMNNEINTAVCYAAPVSWIVLNDGMYNMVEQVVDADDMAEAVSFVPVDWVQVACGFGAKGVRVIDEAELDAALQMALEAEGPFIVDVVIDPGERAPVDARKRSLAKSGT